MSSKEVINITIYLFESNGVVVFKKEDACILGELTPHWVQELRNAVLENKKDGSM